MSQGLHCLCQTCCALHSKPCKAVLCAAQVRCFGMGMVNLDCRQESSRHSDVIDRVTTYLGLGSYK